MEDAGGETSEELNLDFIFLPPPEFQSSPLDPQPDAETAGNGAKPSELPKDPFEALTPDPFQMPPNASTKDYFNDITLNSPDLFKPVLAPTPPALQLKSSDLLEGEGVDLLLGPKGGGLLPAERTREPNLSGKPPSVFGNSFESPSNEDDRLFRAPKPANPFGPDSSRSVNLRDPFMSSFHDVFSSSSAAVDPFPSPIARDLLFRDVSGSEDPFGATPSGRYDPFRDVSPGAPDIFRPFPSETDVFGMTSGNTAPKAAAAAFSTPSAAALSPLPVSEATMPEPRAKPLDVFLTTPRGTDVDILEPSPFSRSRNRSMLRNVQSPAEMNHVRRNLIFGRLVFLRPALYSLFYNHTCRCRLSSVRQSQFLGAEHRGPKPPKRQTLYAKSPVERHRAPPLCSSSVLLMTFCASFGLCR